MIRAGTPAQYWAGIHLTLAADDPQTGRRPLTLVIVSNSLTGGGLFFDPRPWAGLAAAGLLLSALVWLPVVGGATRTIRKLNDASRRIAAGRFDVRLPEGRADELGELAASVNAMAAQLGNYVEMQKRITADVAHELCSPIARMQMALGVVEQRGTPGQQAYLKRLDAELQHMARLVEEVLAFSKAESLPEQETPELFSLQDVVRSVIAREAADAAVEVNVPAQLRLHTLKNAVERALGNVIRNAARYAAEAGPIGVWVKNESNKLVIHVADQGPGVPPSALPRLFDPFFRPEAARARQTGGSGLGLAIAKRCIEACGGSISARLRQPCGLEVEICLPLATAEISSCNIEPGGKPAVNLSGSSATSVSGSKPVGRPQLSSPV
jgi:two-component system sensor histidine kinase CpxA